YRNYRKGSALTFALPAGACTVAAVLACGLATLTLAAGRGWPFGEWRRVVEEPVIAPRGTGWEAAGTFNPAVVLHNGKYVMLYRAQDAAGTSRLGYAESSNGMHFTRRSEPVFVPGTDSGKDDGPEAAGLVVVGR